MAVVTPVPIRLDGPSAEPAIAWAEGMQFRVPRGLVEQSGWIDRLTSAGDLGLSTQVPGIDADDVRRAREYAAFTETAPASARLPISYQAVPAWARSAIASIVGRGRRRKAAEWAAFPAWPLDLTVDLLSDLAGLPRPPIGDRTPVLLTHDIDSAEGLRNLVDSFLPCEEAAGARSANYVVPCQWPLDGQLLGEIRARGHEIGVHGYDHSNRTPFLAPDDRRRRLDAIRPFIERYEASGYRAPSLLRTRALLRDLATRFSYDSSVPTAGGLFPVGNNGCATARPFHVEGIVELPVTLPRDGSLRFLGHPPAEILQMWRECADLIGASGGMVVLLTHCERRFSGMSAMLDAYRGFIDYIRSEPERFVFRTPNALLHTLRAAGF